jgi:hypothetical protein
MERFEWDVRKAEINLRTHGISFETAKKVFFDPFVLLRKDHTAIDGEREQAIGLVGSTLLILVVHTVTHAEKDTIIRIISARKAERREQNLYRAPRV